MSQDTANAGVLSSGSLGWGVNRRRRSGDAELFARLRGADGEYVRRFPAASHGDTLSGMSAGGAFVGRAAQLATTAGELDAARSGRPRVLLVEGAAAIGEHASTTA